jgi:hypothetical protein
MLDFRLLTGALVMVAGALILIGFHLFGGKIEVVALAREEAPRAEWLTIEKLPPAYPRVAALAPARPTREQAIEWLSFRDIVNDTRMDPAPAIKPPRTFPLASAKIEADTKMDAATEVALANESARPVSLVLPRSGLEFAGPPEFATRIATTQTRADPDPQTTGSIDLPDSVQAPEPRPAPAATRMQPRAVAYRAPRQAQPAEEAQPPQPPNLFAVLFPFAAPPPNAPRPAPVQPLNVVPQALPPAQPNPYGGPTPCCYRPEP